MEHPSNPISDFSNWFAGIASSFILAVGGWLWKLSGKIASLEEAQRHTAEHVEKLDAKYEKMNDAVIRTDENVQFIKEVLQQPSHLTQHRRHND